MTLKNINAVVFLISFLCFALLRPSAYAADATDEQEAAKYVQQLEKRISDLESAIKDLLKEEKGQSGKSERKADPEAQRKNTEVKSPDAGIKSETGDGEWGELDTKREPAKGRDEDARRRLTELETWKRKTDAKIAKEEEDAAERVKFDFSGKYKLRYNIRNNLDQIGRAHV